MNGAFERLTAGAPATTLLLAAFAVVSLLGLYGRPQLIERHLLRPHGMAQRGDWWTLATCGFIHADIAHLAFNAFTFWSFGPGVERALGTPLYLLLYALGLLGSSGVTWWLHRQQPGYASLGASGAILAVLFASIVLYPQASLMMFPLPVPIPAPLFAVIYLVFSMVASRSRVGRINHDAHIAGAVIGLLFVVVAVPGALSRAVGHFFG